MNKQQKLFYYTHPGIYQKKWDELKSTEEKVIRLLHQYPRLRNSDKLLIFYYWVKVEDYEGSLVEEIIKDLTSSETIRRTRQHIQNDLCLFLPTDPETYEARKICSEAVKAWAIENKKIEAFHMQMP